MAGKRPYTDGMFIAAFTNSCCWAETKRKLGAKSTGGVGKGMKDYAASLGLDVERFAGRCMAHRKENPGRFTAAPIETYLVVGETRIAQHNLKKRLVNEGILQFQCEWCNIAEWRGQPAPLELDHINGDPRDNRLENLRLLCANCHAQTETYCRGSHGLRADPKTNTCADCGSPCGRRAKWCKACGYKNRRSGRSE